MIEGFALNGIRYLIGWNKVQTMIGLIASIIIFSNMIKLMKKIIMTSELGYDQWKNAVASFHKHAVSTSLIFCNFF